MIVCYFCNVQNWQRVLASKAFSDNSRYLAFIYTVCMFSLGLIDCIFLNELTCSRVFIFIFPGYIMNQFKDCRP